MRTPALALLLLGVTMAASAASDQRMLAEEAGGAIVNGQKASRERWRYYARLDIAGGTCGGTLIAPEVVLTAAHCVFYRPGHLERPRDFRVRVGEYFEDLAKPHPRSVRGVKRILPHPQYDPKTMENDVCLLILDAPVTAIQPVKLVGSVPKPNWRNPAPDWSPVTVVGMGELQFDGPNPKIGLTLLPAQQCQVQLSAAAQAANDNLGTNFMTNAMICSLKLDGPGAECRGDSGGPMLVTGATMAEDVQIGVVSWSFKRPREKACLTIPGVFADVGALFPWIDANVLRFTGSRLTPGQLPVQPFSPMYSRVFGDLTAQGFDGSIFTPSSPGQLLDIVVSPQYNFRGRMGPGSRPGSAVLASVSLTWGDGIFVRLERGDLAASVDFGKNVRPGESVALTDGGSLMMFASKPGASRRVDIVKPGVEIRVLQPWVSGPTGGSYAQRLEVWFTLTQRPAGPLSGFLGATYKP